MKIQLNPNRYRAGGIFLIVVIVIIVLIVGGCTVYHVRKWIKRVDEIQQQSTNDTSNISIPPIHTGPPDSVSFYKQGEYTYSTVPITPFPTLAAPAYPAVVLLVSLSNGIPNLSITKDTGWQTVAVPSGTIQEGTPTGIPAKLQRSVDFVVWEDWMTVWLLDGQTVYARDTETFGQTFYRAVRR